MKSLIVTTNKKGPRTDLWGTPIEISNILEFCLLIETNCCLFIHQVWFNQLQRLIWNSIKLSLFSRISNRTQSKASLRSSSDRATDSFALNTSSTESTTFYTTCVVDLASWKPFWLFCTYSANYLSWNNN